MEGNVKINSNKNKQVWYKNPIVQDTRWRVMIGGELVKANVFDNDNDYSYDLLKFCDFNLQYVDTHHEPDMEKSKLLWFRNDDFKRIYSRRDCNYKLQVLHCNDRNVDIDESVETFDDFKWVLKDFDKVDDDDDDDDDDGGGYSKTKNNSSLQIQNKIERAKGCCNKTNTNKKGQKLQDMRKMLLKKIIMKKLKERINQKQKNTNVEQVEIEGAAEGCCNKINIDKNAQIQKDMKKAIIQTIVMKMLKERIAQKQKNRNVEQVEIEGAEGECNKTNIDKKVQKIKDMRKVLIKKIVMNKSKDRIAQKQKNTNVEKGNIERAEECCNKTNIDIKAQKQKDMKKAIIQTIVMKKLKERIAQKQKNTNVEQVEVEGSERECNKTNIDIKVQKIKDMRKVLIKKIVMNKLKDRIAQKQKNTNVEKGKIKRAEGECNETNIDLKAQKQKDMKKAIIQTIVMKKLKDRIAQKQKNTNVEQVEVEGSEGECNITNIDKKVQKIKDMRKVLIKKIIMNKSKDRIAQKQKNRNVEKGKIEGAQGECNKTNIDIKAQKQKDMKKAIIQTIVMKKLKDRIAQKQKNTNVEQVEVEGSEGECNKTNIDKKVQKIKDMRKVLIKKIVMNKSKERIAQKQKNRNVDQGKTKRAERCTIIRLHAQCRRLHEQVKIERAEGCTLNKTNIDKKTQKLRNMQRILVKKIIIRELKERRVQKEKHTTNVEEVQKRPKGNRYSTIKNIYVNLDWLITSKRNQTKKTIEKPKIGKKQQLQNKTKIKQTEVTKDVKRYDILHNKTVIEIMNKVLKKIKNKRRVGKENEMKQLNDGKTNVLTKAGGGGIKRKRNDAEVEKENVVITTNGGGGIKRKRKDVKVEKAKVITRGEGIKRKIKDIEIEEEKEITREIKRKKEDIIQNMEEVKDINMGEIKVVVVELEQNQQELDQINNESKVEEAIVIPSLLENEKVEASKVQIVGSKDLNKEELNEMFGDDNFDWLDTEFEVEEKEITKDIKRKTGEEEELKTVEKVKDIKEIKVVVVALEQNQIKINNEVKVEEANVTPALLEKEAPKVQVVGQDLNKEELNEMFGDDNFDWLETEFEEEEDKAKDITMEEIKVVSEQNQQELINNMKVNNNKVNVDKVMNELKDAKEKVDVVKVVGKDLNKEELDDMFGGDDNFDWLNEDFHVECTQTNKEIKNSSNKVIEKKQNEETRGGIRGFDDCDDDLIDEQMSELGERIDKNLDEFCIENSLKFNIHFFLINFMEKNNQLLLMGKLRHSNGQLDSCTIVLNRVPTLYIVPLDPGNRFEFMFNEVQQKFSRHIRMNTIKVYKTTKLKVQCYTTKFNESMTSARNRSNSKEVVILKVYHHLCELSKKEVMGMRGRSFSNIQLYYGNDDNLIKYFVKEANITKHEWLIVNKRYLTEQTKWFKQLTNAKLEFYTDQLHIDTFIKTNTDLALELPKLKATFILVDSDIEIRTNQEEIVCLSLCNVEYDLSTSTEKVVDKKVFVRRLRKYALATDKPGSDPTKNWPQHLFRAVVQFPEVIKTGSQTILIKQFADYVKKFDPDIILGHDLINQLPILTKACTNLDESEARGVRYFNLSRMTKIEKTEFIFTGRIVLDFNKILDEFQFNIQGPKNFQTICKKANYSVRSHEFYDSFNLKQRFSDYEGLRSLFSIIELSKLTGLFIDQYFKLSTMERFECIMDLQFDKLDYLLPEKVYINDRRKIKGGLVFEPKYGLTRARGIILLDFKSLYPSIIVEQNIDLTLDPTPSKNVLPNLMRNLVHSRDSNKPRDYFGKLLKILANSLFGCLASKSCRYYSFDSANQITQSARTILEEAKNLIENQFQVKVIYGDTDSLMLLTNIRIKLFNIESYKKVKQMGFDIMAFYQNEKQFKAIQFKMESIFDCLWVVRKKKYVATSLRIGRIRVKNPHVLPKPGLISRIIYKGVDVVRIDTCLWVKLIVKHMISLIMRNKSKGHVFDLIKVHYMNMIDSKSGAKPLKPIRLAYRPELGYHQPAEGKFNLIVKNFKIMNRSSQTVKVQSNCNQHAIKSNQMHMNALKRLLNMPHITQTNILQHSIISWYKIIDNIDMHERELQYHRSEKTHFTNCIPDMDYYIEKQLMPCVLRLCDMLTSGKYANLSRDFKVLFNKHKNNNDLTAAGTTQVTMVQFKDFTDIVMAQYHIVFYYNCSRCPNSNFIYLNKKQFTQKDKIIYDKLIKCNHCNQTNVTSAKEIAQQLDNDIGEMLKKTRKLSNNDDDDDDDDDVVVVDGQQENESAYIPSITRISYNEHLFLYLYKLSTVLNTNTITTSEYKDVLCPLYMNMNEVIDKYLHRIQLVHQISYYPMFIRLLSRL